VYHDLVILSTISWNNVQDPHRTRECSRCESYSENCFSLRGSRVDLSAPVFVQTSNDNKRINYEKVSRENLVITLTETRNPGETKKASADSEKGALETFEVDYEFVPEFIYTCKFKPIFFWFQDVFTRKMSIYYTRLVTNVNLSYFKQRIKLTLDAFRAALVGKQ